MAKKPSKSGLGRAIEAIPTASTSPQRDRIRPALKLSELTKTSEVEIAERVRESLPHLEALTKQATEAAAASKGAGDPDLAATSAIRAHIERRPALPSSPIEPMDDTVLSIAITSADDVGQLVREARVQRKLSQQAFADLAGVGRRFLSELENGKATLEFDKVLQVASACGVDMLARRRR